LHQIALAFALRIADCGIRNTNPQFCESAIRNCESAIRRSAIRNAVREVYVAETMFDELGPDPLVTDRQVQVQVLATSMTIHDLSIERASIVDYLKTIAPDKQAIALIHALEVGVTEMLARRGRFQR
jgi:hypothetical protein